MLYGCPSNDPAAQWQNLKNPSIQSFIQPSQAPELYLFAGANVNYTDHALDTPLLYAIAGVDADTYSITYIKLLIRMGADVNHQNNDGNTPLHYAAQNKALTIVELLLQHGAIRSINNKKSLLPAQNVPFSTNLSRNKRAHRILALLNGDLSVEESIQKPIAEE